MIFHQRHKRHTSTILRGPNGTVKWSGPYSVAISSMTLSVNIPLTQYVVHHTYHVEIVRTGIAGSLADSGSNHRSISTDAKLVSRWQNFPRRSLVFSCH